MPISINAFKNPKWIRTKERYPLSYNKKDRFHKFDQDKRSYPEGFKQPGYNPNHNSTRVEKVNIDRDNIQLKPY